MSAHPEPLEISAGDTARWRKTIDSFAVDDLTTIHPVADGYALSYSFRSKEGTIDISATISGDDYLVNVAAATTAGWKAGVYTWDAYLTLGANRYKVDSGRFTILPNLATAGEIEGRTHARIMLDAIKAVLENRATSEIANYTYAGKSITKMTHGELVTAYSFWKSEVAREERAARVLNGEDAGRNVFVRFATPI